MPSGTMMMDGMRMAMPMPYQGTAQEAWLTFVMWVVMMAAMMVPSVAPMVLMFARCVAVAAKRRRPTHGCSRSVTWSYGALSARS